MTLLHTYIRMADTASMDLDQDLSVLGFFDRNFFDGPRRAWLLNDAGFAALWDVWGHCLGNSKQLESKGGFIRIFAGEKRIAIQVLEQAVLCSFILASCRGGY